MPTITINEREYDLLSIDKLTFADQRRLKKATGGMSLQKISDGLDEVDPDAWFGVVLLSVQKINPRFTEAELNELNMVELINAMKDEDDEEEPANPPAPAAPEAADASASDSTKSSDGAETPETSGTPTSLESSD